MLNDERRRHRRLEVQLGVELQRDGSDSSRAHLRTENVGTGGLYVRGDAGELRKGDRVRVKLQVPPSEGVSAAEMRAECFAEVIRIDPTSGTHQPTTSGIALRFMEPLAFNF